MRVYSQEIASTVNGELNKIKESINVADYSLSGIDDDGRGEYAKCCTAVNSAIDQMNDLKDDLALLMRQLEILYSAADETFNEVFDKASNIASRLSILTSTVNSLTEAVGSVGVYSGQALSKSTIDSACSKMKELRLAAKSKNAWKGGKDSWKDFCQYLEEEFNVSGIDQERAQAFCIMTDLLRERGYFDETVYLMSPAILGDDRILPLTHIPGSEVDKFRESKFWITSCLKTKFRDIINSKRAEDNSYSGCPIYKFDSFLNTMESNLSVEDMRQFANSVIDTVRATERLSDDEKLQDMLKYAIACKGYEGSWARDGDGKLIPVSFYSSFYLKDPSHWCAEFVVFNMVYSGLLNPGSSTFKDKKGEVNFNNAIILPNGKGENHSWASQEEIRKSFEQMGRFQAFADDKSFMPSVGDLMICHANGHVAIVAGVDLEKHIVVTIEGNNNNSALFCCYNMDDEKDCTHDDLRNIIGFCKMGGNCQDMHLVEESNAKDYVYTMNWNGHVRNCYHGDRDLMVEVKDEATAQYFFDKYPNGRDPFYPNSVEHREPTLYSGE